MRSNLSNLALAAGCLGGASSAAIGTFFAMLYALRFVCWIRNDNDCMLLMWFGVAVEPLAIIIGFALGYRLVARLLGPPLLHTSNRGFEVLVDSSKNPDEDESIL